VRATHGETVRQVLGSGDGGQKFQKFALAKGPLTHLSAPTPTGVQSTLQIRVGDLRWHERESLLDSAPADRNFVVDVNEYWQSSAQFGDGVTGARLPTGRENVRAEYRVGLGQVGNIKARRITQLAQRPLGVKEVINPLPASGGADPETVDQIRANAPLAVMALDRLVSTRDYADFAQNYAAIDKADAARLLVGGQPTVCVTIAGANDIPIPEDSDLIANLRRAYDDWGDPLQSVDIGTRELVLIFLSAQVRLRPDYEWKSVEPKIRGALYNYFSFCRRRLGQDAYLSEARSVIQHVEGVLYVNVDIFSGLPESDFREKLAGSSSGGGAPPADLNENDDQSLAGMFNKLSKAKDAVIQVKNTRLELDADNNPRIKPAQLAYLSDDVPDSLFLQEITL
jgi:predicted phage baseplate assembly protein